MEVTVSTEKVFSFLFLGQNGVMVLSHTLWKGYGHTVEFSDNQSFNLTAQSHQFALDAILCEKGEVLTDTTGHTHAFIQDVYTDNIVESCNASKCKFRQKDNIDIYIYIIRYTSRNFLILHDQYTIWYLQT